MKYRLVQREIIWSCFGSNLENFIHKLLDLVSIQNNGKLKKLMSILYRIIIVSLSIVQYEMMCYG